MMCIILLLFSAQTIGANSEIPGFATASTSFSLNFFRQAYNQAPDKNSVISPISIQSTLAMLYHVANENASLEMQLVFGLPQDKIEAVRNLEAFLHNSNNKALRIASKLYHAKQELNPNVLPILKEKYNIEVEAVNFIQSRIVARSANKWANRVTNGMINDLLNPEDLSVHDCLLLLNAVTLDVPWKRKFRSSSTLKKIFHFENGDHEIDMMRGDDGFEYGEVDDLRALELSYEEDSDLAFRIIMPKNGSLGNLIHTFNNELYRKLGEAMKPTSGVINIPKFSISSAINVTGILQSMGLNEIFEEKAFEVFTKLRPKLAEIKQNAKIDVTEDGTSAAAITRTNHVLLSRKIFTFTITVDRPFLYLIRRKSTKDIIFIGHFSQYEQGSMH